MAITGGSVHVGDVEVIGLLDTVGVLGELAELFPAVPAGHWAPWRELYPELFAGDSWRLPVRSFLIRAAGRAILVDTAVGPSGEGKFMPDRQGRLLGELERQGVTPHGVDTVFLTHLHVDHVGWNSAFRDSRFLTHEDGAARVRDRSRLPASLETVAGETELAPGVMAFETPGHEAGHMSVRVGQELVILGDVAPHPAQLTQAGWVFKFDADAELAEQTREEVLAEYGDRTLACGHYPGTGFGRLVDGIWTANA